jgi:hypothetical protein
MLTQPAHLLCGTGSPHHRAGPGLGGGWQAGERAQDPADFQHQLTSLRRVHAPSPTSAPTSQPLSPDPREVSPALQWWTRLRFFCSFTRRPDRFCRSFTMAAGMWTSCRLRQQGLARFLQCAAMPMTRRVCVMSMPSTPGQCCKS